MRSALWPFRYEPNLLLSKLKSNGFVFSSVSNYSNPFESWTICMISDTHNQHKLLDLNPEFKKGGDIVIHAGDFTVWGTRTETVSFLDWFSVQAFTHKILVAGNHDEENDEFSSLYSGYPSIVYLQDSFHTIFAPEKPSIKIWGSPWTIQRSSKHGSFTLPMETLEQKWDCIPNDIDILITHEAPFGHSFTGIKGKSGWIPLTPKGDLGLLLAIDSKKPKIHVFGHIHTGYGIKVMNHVLCINASLCNEENQLANEPIWIKK